MVKPVNGKNPLVLQALDIDFPMPGEVPEPGEEYFGEYYDEDEEGEELPEPRSEDERMNGVNVPPPDPARQAQRRKRRRLPPMPDVPVPEHADIWHAPFDVLPDGTVVGVPLSKDGDPPIEELPDAILADGTVEPFDPGRGSLEGVSQMFRGR